jgi:SEC-C motif-containing protein
MKQNCPCGTENKYEACCGKYIDKNETPPTPEALMRSRYTAFTQANTDYIAKTMVSPSIDDFNAEETKAFASSVEWLNLDIIKSSSQGNQGLVEFKAHFKKKHDKHVIHEISSFTLKNGAWFYVDGSLPPATRTVTIGRNDPCMCGSGKKYKKCCA